MFCERFKELRKYSGFSQAQLAKKLNVSQQCISDWETGIRKPTISMLKKIALIFSVSADYLLGLNDNKFIDVSGLNEEQITTLQNLIDSLTKNK